MYTYGIRMYIYMRDTYVYIHTGYVCIYTHGIRIYSPSLQRIPLELHPNIYLYIQKRHVSVQIKHVHILYMHVFIHKTRACTDATHITKFAGLVYQKHSSSIAHFWRVGSFLKAQFCESVCKNALSFS